MLKKTQRKPSDTSDDEESKSPALDFSKSKIVHKPSDLIRSVSILSDSASKTLLAVCKYPGCRKYEVSKNRTAVFLAACAFAFTELLAHPRTSLRLLEEFGGALTGTLKQSRVVPRWWMLKNKEEHMAGFVAKMVKARGVQQEHLAEQLSLLGEEINDMPVRVLDSAVRVLKEILCGYLEEHREMFAEKLRGKLVEAISQENEISNDKLMMTFFQTVANALQVDIVCHTDSTWTAKQKFLSEDGTIFPARIVTLEKSEAELYVLCHRSFLPLYPDVLRPALVPVPAAVVSVRKASSAKPAAAVEGPADIQAAAAGNSHNMIIDTVLDGYENVIRQAPSEGKILAAVKTSLEKLIPLMTAHSAERISGLIARCKTSHTPPAPEIKTEPKAKVILKPKVEEERKTPSQTGIKRAEIGGRKAKCVVCFRTDRVVQPYYSACQVRCVLYVCERCSKGSLAVSSSRNPHLDPSHVGCPSCKQLGNRGKALTSVPPEQQATLAIRVAPACCRCGRFDCRENKIALSCRHAIDRDCLKEYGRGSQRWR